MCQNGVQLVSPPRDSLRRGVGTDGHLQLGEGSITRITRATQEPRTSEFVPLRFTATQGSCPFLKGATLWNFLSLKIGGNRYFCSLNRLEPLTGEFLE